VGFLWDLLQQSQIAHQNDRAATVEQRLERAEADVARLTYLVHELIGRLESHLGADLNRDGRIGNA
jgi:hypothetical protein